MSRVTYYHLKPKNQSSQEQFRISLLLLAEQRLKIFGYTAPTADGTKDNAPGDF